MLILGELVGMKSGLPKKVVLSTKGKQGNGVFSPNPHACVSVSKLISMSHASMHVTISVTLTCLEMMLFSLTHPSQDMLILH